MIGLYSLYMFFKSRSVKIINLFVFLANIENNVWNTMTFECNFDILLILLFVEIIFISDNSNCCYLEDQMQNYILNIKTFEVLQNINMIWWEKKSGWMQIGL